ncbi:MAG: amino acid adenylation domain-containing protein [bacterium]|nr:amino acid adenylation domain-containing protein [bacterium]
MDSNKGSHRGLPLQPLRYFVRPFDLSRAPLMRVGVTETGNGRYMMMVDIHHIVSDGVSQGVLEKDFIALYSGETLQPLPLQYKDFSLWQADQRQKESFQIQQAYWLEQFNTRTGKGLPLLALPTDYPRPPVQRFEGRTVSFRLPGETTRMLNAVASETGSTLFMVLLSAVNILLFRLSNQEDVIVGTPIAGRRHSDLEKIIGMFVNTLALRNTPEGEISVGEFLHRIKDRTMNAFENQEFPFEDLVDIANITRDASRNPVFDIMIVLENFDRGIHSNTAPASGKQQATPPRESQPVDAGHQTAKFDLTFGFIDTGEQIKASLNYSTHLFKRETIERMVGYFQRIAAVAFDNLSMKLHQIRMMSEEERKQVLYDFNNTGRAYPGDKTIHELFEETVVKQPYHIAVVYEDRQLTYRQLDQRSNHLAAYLHDQGVREGHSVGIMAGPSLELVIAVLSIFKAGGAYLPINPDYSEERVDFMLKDSNAVLCISDDLGKGKLNDQLSIINYQLLMKTSAASAVKPITGPAPSTLRPASLAYITYTSGTTGKPKGVLVQHRNVVRLVKNTNYISFRKNSRLLQTGALEYDTSTFEIWGPLLNGLSLHLAGKETILAPDRLKRSIDCRDIDIMWMTSPLFNRMVEADLHIFSGLTDLLVGGEILSPFHINRLRETYPSLNVINGYGPTENTTFSTTFLIDKEYKENIPIGRPVANSTAYILDRFNGLQPIGVVGELYVGGDGLSRGYLNDPKLTVEQFVNHYFSSTASSGVTLFKTGDLARWLPDGNIEFAGRIHPPVKSGESAIDGTVEEPAAIHVAPRDDVEETLAAIWSEILHPDVSSAVIGIDDNFFEVGGHSLSVGVMTSKILEQLGVDVPMVEVLKTPFIRQLGEYIKVSGGIDVIEGRRDIVLLSEEYPEAGCLFLVHDGSGEVEGYVEFCKHLDIPVNCWGIRATELENYTPESRSIDTVASSYIEKLRSIQPQGPYMIGGWSLGGTIAFEMVRQLELSGDQVSLLALFDSPPPGSTGLSSVEAQPFTLDTEKDFIKKYLKGRGVDKSMEPVTELDKMWPFVVAALGANRFDLEVIREIIIEHEAHVVPNYDQLGVGALIGYLNIGRTFRNAMALYIPSSILSSPVHYFAAGESIEIEKERWNNYCETPIGIYEVVGDHYSIFKKPHVSELAKVVSKLLAHREE